jgi:hypothetical protein
MTWALLVATVLGCALTVLGLVNAYRSAKNQLDVATERLRRTEELMEVEDKELKDFQAKTGDWMNLESPSEFYFNPEIGARSEARFQAAGLDRPVSNLETLPLLEMRRFLGEVFAKSRNDLLTAGLGLIVSTAASAVSLFV